MLRRRLILAALLCFQALPAMAFESLEDLELRWRDLMMQVQHVPYGERLERSTAFLNAVPWEQVVYYCGDSSAGFGPDRLQFLAGFVDAMLRRTTPSVPDLAAMIADPEMNPACQGAVAKFISIHRDSIAACADGELLGRAFFDLAGSGARSAQITRESYIAAASLWAGGPVMRRMMTDARQADERLAQRGIDMLVSSCDSSATDSLQGVLAEYLAAGQLGQALGRGITGLSVRGGPERFDFFHAAYQQRPPDARDMLRRGLLLAMARSQNPAVYPVILEAYNDTATGPVDSTWIFKGEDQARYSFYYWLWQCTREAEPGIIAALDADAPEVHQAVELLDRASRFGLPAGREALLEPLAAWGARQGTAGLERTALIIKRFRSYPDPRQG